MRDSPDWVKFMSGGYSEESRRAIGDNSKEMSHDTIYSSPWHPLAGYSQSPALQIIRSHFACGGCHGTRRFRPTRRILSGSGGKGGCDYHPWARIGEST